MSRYAWPAGCLLLSLAGLAFAVQAAAEEPIAPQETIKLFNGQDLTGWISWLKGSGKADPQKVFTVQDGTIHISGHDLGYLRTNQAYKNYHLSLEYKWGDYGDSGQRKYVRNSGLLVHAVGPDGGHNNTFMHCLECQIAQGCEGDLIPIDGKDESGKRVVTTITCETAVGPDKHLRWKQGGAKAVSSDKQIWWAEHEPFFKEAFDTRGKNDPASWPPDRWTRFECIADGSRLTLKVNGVVVNEALEVSPAAGYILLEEEGSEIFFRNIELHPLKK